jgi:hypothetical protein
MQRTFGMPLFLAVVVGLMAFTADAAPVGVAVHRVPEGGLQPQVAVDSLGTVHLIYLKGDPAGSDVFYVRSTDDGQTWSNPIRVNRVPGSAIALGTVRGAHLAVGRNGRVHVAWMGSKDAEPKAPNGKPPMLYARLSASGDSFEPERNLISSHVGVDGGGSVAADEAGNVYVAWHAPERPGGKEQDRRVWVARSTDDGVTFAPEVALSKADTGACACCGMRIAARDGKVFVLYRGASQQINRGMYLSEANADLTEPRSREISPMKIGMCVMSTSAFNPNSSRVLAAWQTGEQVYWSDASKALAAEGNASAPPGAARDRKHPAIATIKSGEVLLAWTEGTAWNKGGRLAWQLFKSDGKPVEGSAGTSDDLPAWGSPAVFVARDQHFVVLY